MTLLHRQMMLEIASSSKQKQQRYFLATIAIELTGILILLLLISIFWILYSSKLDLAEYQGVAVFSLSYVILFIIYDIFKQYSYTTENQIYSLRVSIVFFACQSLALAYIYYSSTPDDILIKIYSGLSTSLLVAIVSNRYCIKNLRLADSISYKFCRSTLAIYFKQGRFSLFGMAITWIQNQSMNPFLMLIGGPLVAGYFSVGRLLIMPVAVVTQGIVNSTLPGLRRLFKKHGAKTLTPKIYGYFLKTCAFTLSYFILLAILHISGILNHLLTDYDHIKWFLLYWVTISSLTMVRFWNAQYFVVSMQFKFLLKLSILSALITVIGMTVFGILFDSIVLALATVIFSECLIIIAFQLEKKKLEKQ